MAVLKLERDNRRQLLHARTRTDKQLTVQLSRINSIVFVVDFFLFAQTIFLILLR